MVRADAGSACAGASNACVNGVSSGVAARTWDREGFGKATGWRGMSVAEPVGFRSSEESAEATPDESAPDVDTSEQARNLGPERETPSHSGSPWAAAFGRYAWPGAFVAIFAMGFGIFRPRPAPEVKPTVVEAPSATVVSELRGLGRLETAAVHVEKVVDVTDTQKRLFGLVEAHDSLLYVASGELVLGVDLQKLRDGDARFDAATKTAYVRLPEPELFSSRLDEVHSHVHARTTELLAEKNDTLEAVARGRALAAFEAAAHDPKALELARAQAERQLRHLAKAWGARELEVSWRDVPAERGLTFAPAPPADQARP